MSRFAKIRGKVLVLGAFVFFLVGVVAWIWWAEAEPEREREVRLGMRSLLTEWFPAAMEPPEGTYGLFAHGDAVVGSKLSVVLVHGLDEPGGIWDELIPVLGRLRVDLWEFRYPNDQAIDRSTDFLADCWNLLDEEKSVVLIGHSMGGLVARDFVSRWRHPVEGDSLVSGASAEAVYLVGTPNHGSEWARLRIWLELRDQFESSFLQEFSLFSALRDGFGTAKVDLRPGSEFLTTLNARPWPADVEVRTIGGVVLEDRRLDASVDWLLERSQSEATDEALKAWWEQASHQLGDGVVTLESLSVEGYPPPVIFPATHRGLLRNTVVEEGRPPAVSVLAQWIGESLGSQ